MDWRKGEQVDQPSQPERPVKKKVITWIRPRDVSVELRMFASYYLLPPFRLGWRNLLRLGIDLVGVGILFCSIWLIMAHALISSYAPIPDTSLSNSCTSLQHCVEAGGTLPAIAPQPRASTRPRVTRTTVSSPSHQSSPTPLGVLTPSPTARPTPTSSPTPSIAILSVKPTALTVSYKAVCKVGGSTTIVLSNAGGAPLEWLEDKTYSSPGISITDPTKLYLLKPGQSITADVFCSAKNIKGHQYQLQIDYNGGVSVVVVSVTP